MNINNPTTFSTPDLTLSTSNSSGTAGALRADDTLLVYDATVPTTIASGASAAAGDTATAARRNHTHGAPALPSAATKAELETGTITTAYTSPGNQQAHDSAAKAWARVASDGTLASPSYNTNSITHPSTGVYYHVFETDFDDADFVYVATSRSENGAIVCGGAADVEEQRVVTQNSGHNDANSAWSGVAFGQQAT